MSCTLCICNDNLELTNSDKKRGVNVLIRMRHEVTINVKAPIEVARAIGAIT